MGKKKSPGGSGKEAKDVGKLHKKVRALEKKQARLQARLTELEQVVASLARERKAVAGQPLPYPEPMKSGRYQSPGYADYRITLVEPLTPTVMRLVAQPAGQTRAGALGLACEYIRVITGKKGEVLGPPSLEGKKPSWDRPTTSTKYTVRRYEPESGELEINVVLHEKGAGTTWARTVQTGDLMHITGAKSGYTISPDYSFYLLAGDETGLPGMARFLESLPHKAHGAIFIEVPSPESQQQLIAPDHFKVSWVDSREPGALAEAVQAHPLPRGSIFTWFAGESFSIHPLRTWARRQLELPKGHGYAKGYWKRK